MGHVSRASEFVANVERTQWHDQALWFVRSKRDQAADRVPDWEALREQADAIKRNALGRLPELWTLFEANAVAAGAVVHWARDAREHNEIVAGLLRERGIRRVVKSKSMLTEECGLNRHLEEQAVEVVDTDLGERIVQLRHEPPSHIVMPAIHLRRSEVGDLFANEMGSPAGLDDPIALTAVARRDLRQRFLAAEAGLTGVNFAVAETGSFVVVTNEGNADLGTALPPLHIASVGLEKIVPQQRAPGRTSGGTRHTRASHRDRRQRAKSTSGSTGVSRGPGLYPLRSLSQHMPGLPAKRRTQLWDHDPRTDRFRPGAEPRPRSSRRTSACL
jgi:L-lactate dehydrogenase complex protein LldF